MLRRLRCLFRGHDWHSEYDQETKRTTWDCRRCGAFKVTPKMYHADTGMAGPV